MTTIGRGGFRMSKVAIVTGAGQGIGFAISKRLVEDGFKVGVLDYDAETAEKAVVELSEDKAFSVVADVSKQAEVAAAFQKVVDHFGDLNVVVNNASVHQQNPLTLLLKNSFNVHLTLMLVELSEVHKLPKHNLNHLVMVVKLSMQLYKQVS